MNWEKLLCSKRYGTDRKQSTQQFESRTEFQRDYDRIIFSSPFRRLQGKTQVFPLPGRVFVHNRLTHSLEVASVGRSLGNIVAQKIIKRENLPMNHPIGELGAIISAACLSHDLGNPPFGHSGEKAISHFFNNGNGKSLQKAMKHDEWLDITKFEGNANVLRILTHQFKGRRKGGLNLTYATIAALLKYPWGSDYAEKHNCNKYGFFSVERDTFLEIAKEVDLIQLSGTPLSFCRHPLVYLVEAADDISYQIMDIEDAHKLGIISTNQTREVLFNFIDGSNSNDLKDKILKTFSIVTDINEQISYLRAIIINQLTNEVAEIFMQKYFSILAGESTKSLVKYLSSTMFGAMEYCSNFSIEKIYNHSSVIEIEIAGYNIIDTLLNEFINALLSPDDHYSKKVSKLIPKQFETESSEMYKKVFSVLDFVSGMTDTFAFDLYKNFKGIRNF